MPDDAASKWAPRAERLLEQALDEVRNDHDAAIGTAEAALLAVRAWAGELPEAEAAELAADLDWEPECICPPDLVARGGFRGGCPVHSMAAQLSGLGSPPMTAAEHDPLAEAREIMKQQAREAGQKIVERWHNHTSLAYCHPSRCPAGGTDWDGRGLVSDHFTAPGEGTAT